MSQESYSNEWTRCEGSFASLRHVKPRLLLPSASPLADLSHFPREMLSSLMQWMELDTLLSFMLTCRTIHQKAVQHQSEWKELVKHCTEWTLEKTRSRILSKLSLLPEGVGECLLNLIRKERGLLAGGSVLEALLDAHFKGTDFDIYLKAEPWMDSSDARFKCFSLLDKAFEPMRLRGQKKPHWVVRGHDYALRVLCIAECLFEGTKVQVMMVDCKRGFELSDFVLGTFDLSFCKNWFDGERVVASRLHDSLNRVGTVDWGNMALHDAMRNNLKVFNGLYRCILLRIAKYEERGLAVRNRNAHLAKHDLGTINVWRRNPFASSADWTRTLNIDLARQTVFCKGQSVLHSYNNVSYAFERGVLSMSATCSKQAVWQEQAERSDNESDESDQEDEALKDKVRVEMRIETSAQRALEIVKLLCSCD